VPTVVQLFLELGPTTDQPRPWLQSSGGHGVADVVLVDAKPNIDLLVLDAQHRVGRGVAEGVLNGREERLKKPMFVLRGAARGHARNDPEERVVGVAVGDSKQRSWFGPRS
jgi:hypothetical protein